MDAVGLNGVDLAWPAGADNGAAIDLYEVRIAGGASKSVSGNNTSWSGLAYATTYRFEARAHNSAGWGPWGGGSGPYLTAQPPGKPILSVPAAKVTDTSAEISFSSSTCTTADYHILGSSMGHKSPGWPRAWQKDVDCWFSHGHTFTGLTPGTTYSLGVDIRDTAGGASNTQQISFKTLGPPPSPPQLTVTSVTESSFTATATASECAILTIEVTPSPIMKTATTGQTCKTSLTYTFTEMAPGTAYNVTLSGVVNGGAFPERVVSVMTKGQSSIYDINRDTKINCGDVDTMTKADWGTNAARSDLNNDGTVSVLDLSKLLANLPAGTTCPTS